RIKKIFAGSYHNFAVNDDNIIYTWGLNNYGQCGIESSDSYILHSTKVEFFQNFHRVKQIAAGMHHSLALLENGNLYSFGHANYGQLGIGEVSTDKVSMPIHITKLVNCQKIAVGNHHSLAVNEKVHMWGFGETYALEDTSGENKKFLFEINCTEIGNKILSICGGSQCSVILSQFND
ncbi:26601_t:CDS:1, partial [Dentiscutata erythropus]